MKKAEKVTFVERLTRDLQGTKSVVLVNYAGLGVKAQQELKNRLRDGGSRMVVVKNTLLKRAGETAKIDKEILTDSVLSGQTALIISGDDAVSPIQVLGKFAKENETPQFKVGIVDGTFYDTASLTHLSNLPGRDVLLSQLLGVLMSSEYGLIGTLNGNLQKLVYVLSSKAGGEN